MVLVMTLSLVTALPFVQNTAAVTLYPFITVSPNPIGVGQSVLIVAGFDFPTRGLGFKGYDGWTVNVTDPNGKQSTLGPFNSDSTGLFSTTYTPDVIGNYTFSAHYPGRKS